MGRGMHFRRAALLLAAAITVIVGVFVTWRTQRSVPARDYEIKIDAAQRMVSCMVKVREEKTSLGIPISPEDVHESGLIGDPYTAITTTLGAIEAKRTASAPDMAALVVQLLGEAGVQPGDRVAAGFSGSFPGLNLAVICACDAMGAELVYISSVGSSTYGANQPELTFPDIAMALYSAGLISSPGAANTPGGSGDCGLDMDEAVLSDIILRLDSYSVPLIIEEDFARNLSNRMGIYGEDVTCFIGVGGNVTTSGMHEKMLPYGVIEPDESLVTDEYSGLLERYCAAGLPTIHLLNVKQLAAQYGIPYDPETVAEIGTGGIYFTTQVSKIPPAICLAVTCILLLAYRRAAKGEEEE